RAFPAAVTPTRTMAPALLPTVAPPPMPPTVVPSVIPPPQPARSSRRGLYMALGSVVTLAVLVAAVIEGPKLMHGGAADAQGVPATPAAATPAIAAPAAAPAAAAAPATQAPPEPAAQATQA